MSKIHLIIKKEYTERVMKRSFILMTFLTPVLLVGIGLLPMLIMQMRVEKKNHIVVIDQTGLYRHALPESETYTFEFTDLPVSQVREENRDSKSFTALLHITDDLSRNPSGATLYSEKQLGIELVEYLKSLLSRCVEEQKLASYDIPGLKEIVQDAKVQLHIATIKWDEQGSEKVVSSELAVFIGMMAALLIYMFIFIYGMQVTMSVMQEKSNRIVEIIVSSVRPFELMMGKVVGVALVGLTQMFMWVVLTMLLFSVSFLFVGDSNMLQAAAEPAALQGLESSDDLTALAAQAYAFISSFNWLQIGILFFVYFLGGYFFYASLFAAIGAAVDSEADVQQFNVVLTFPIVLSIFAAIYSTRDPESSLAFWTSIIPFTSPVVMMSRLPFDVPAWEIALSLAVLVLSFVGSIWLSGKIYRTGILMYGKSPSWKELWKWIRY